MAVGLSGGAHLYLTGAAPDYNSNYTLFLRVRPTISASHNLYAISDGSTANLDGIWLNSLRCELEAKVGGSYVVSALSTSGSAMEADTSYYIAVVRSGTTITAYIGTTPAGIAAWPSASGSGSITGRAASSAVTLGDWVHGAGDSFVGHLDQCRIWERALTLAEIKAEAAADTTVDDTDLWDAWALSSTSDLTSLNNRTFTTSGSPTSEDPIFAAVAATSAGLEVTPRNRWHR